MNITTPNEFMKCFPGARLCRACYPGQKHQLPQTAGDGSKPQGESGLRATEREGQGGGSPRAHSFSRP